MPKDGLHRQILRLAVPSILANITIPLVGLVDTAIVGHIADASAIGGIAIGTMLFDLLYWNFGFLRVGTSGLTAQAYGREHAQSAGFRSQVSSFRSQVSSECAELLMRSLRVALIGALCCIAIQWVFVKGVLALVPCSEEVAAFASRYFFVRIWAAPATLCLMAMKGWFIGMQDTVSPMATDIVVNAVNIAASYVLAVCTPLGAVGVAWGTLIAQYVGLALACGIVAVKYGLLRRKVLKIKRERTAEGASLFALNSQLFVRSLCFMVVYVGFTALASKYGDTELAVASIMMKLFMLFSYFVDGFAYAGEALVGKMFGEGRRQDTGSLVRNLFVWSVGIGAAFTLLYAVLGEGCVRLMTDDTAVLNGATPYIGWLIAMPIVSTLAFMWDGIFVGAAAGKEIRNAMIWAALAFVAGYATLAPAWGAQAIYAGYFAHLAVRVGYLTAKWRSFFSAEYA